MLAIRIIITSRMSSEIRSNSSSAISAIQFNSKSLNPLDSLHPSIIAKIKREADSYSNCASRCNTIWEALTKSDIAGENLTEKVIEVVFKEHQSDIYTFTRVSSLREFMRIFDQDHDGALNPDQQIQIFLFIKERLELIAGNCLQIQSYPRFEGLMREVRLLEGNIAKWQGLLRDKIHFGQVRQYKKQGEKRVDTFCDKYEDQFSNLQKIKIQRRQNFQKQSYYQFQNLQQRLVQPSEYMRIKPTHRIKQLQMQEKLVSLEERVYEAMDFRRQLSELEIKEKSRIDGLMSQHADQQRNSMRKKQAKHREELEVKLSELEDKLVIKMKKEFDVLRKKNNLYEIQIHRLQGLEKKWAIKKGIFEPELKRTKKLEKQRNEVIQSYKKSVFGVGMDQIMEERNGQVSKFNPKSLLSVTTKFNLTNHSGSEIPVNSKSLKVGVNPKSSILKYIGDKQGEKSYSLCRMYDSNLDEVAFEPIVSQGLKQERRNRKYRFIMDKVQGN